MTNTELYDRYSRPHVVGPDDKPEAPFPLKISGPVIAGFGRGSSDLGIPTANIPQQKFDQQKLCKTGVYYGWAAIYPNDQDQEDVEQYKNNAGSRTVDWNYGKNLKKGLESYKVWPMVMSVGWNPFYGNKEMATVSTPLPSYFFIFFFFLENV
jgi:riboflavin kinase